MPVCVPTTPKCFTDILSRGCKKITFFKYYGKSKKWKKAKIGVWATIATIVSEKISVCVPLAPKCSTDIFLGGNEKITFKQNNFKILRSVQKMEKSQK